MVEVENFGCVITHLGEKVDGHDLACSLAVEPIPVPVLKDGEVLVDIKSVGICGSDVHYWRHGKIGQFKLASGSKMVVGHECSGVIVGIGNGVDKFKIGDRVALEPGVACGTCEYCNDGRYNLCPHMAFWATPPYHGALCKQIAHPASHCFHIPDGVSYDEAALVEPFSVGLQACKRAGVKPGHRVLVMGAGPIGLVSLMAARALGASEVVICDILPERMELAKELGATKTIQTQPKDPEFSILREVRTAVDCTVECTGVAWCLSQGIRATRTGGKVVMVGCGAETVTLPAIDALVREVDLLGNFRYCNTWPAALEMLADKKIDLQSLITHTYSFEKPGDVQAAFYTCLHNKDASGKSAVKVMIRVNE